MPEHPQEKSAFLTAPECTENEAHGHLVVEVLPDVFEFIPVSTEQSENQRDGRKCADGVDVKGLTPNRFPSAQEGDQGYERGAERQGDKALTEAGDSGPFPDVIHQPSAWRSSPMRTWLFSLYLDGHFISISVA